MDSYFTDASMLRRVIRETAVALSGPRALLMQAAHPVAFAGFFAHTGALDDPYARLQRTADVLNTIAFGTRDDADRATARVRAMHRRVRGATRVDAGRFPAGTPYAADDPELLLWILATLVDSALLVYPRTVRSLSAADEQALWDDYRQVGRLFGLGDADMPERVADFRAYVEHVVEHDLHVTEAARELATDVVLHPPAPLWARGAVELVNQITIGMLPARVRRQYGFSWDPARAAALALGSAYAKRVLVPLLPGRLRVVGVAREAERGEVYVPIARRPRAAA
jgi:uncharacterized protein (DUF2236 family)